MAKVVGFWGGILFFVLLVWGIELVVVVVVVLWGIWGLSLD